MTNKATQRGDETPVRDGNSVFRERFPLARVLWSQKIGDGGVGWITAYSLGRTFVLIHQYGTRDGWNAFTPTTDDGRIDITLDEIAKRAGV